MRLVYKKDEKNTYQAYAMMSDAAWEEFNSGNILKRSKYNWEQFSTGGDYYTGFDPQNEESIDAFLDKLV